MSSCRCEGYEFTYKRLYGMLSEIGDVMNEYVDTGSVSEEDALKRIEDVFRRNKESFSKEAD